jgi:hypothetical protein
VSDNNNNNKLIVLACGSFEKKLVEKNADILAFTISSMAQLDQYEIEYLSLSDFVTRNDASTDTNNFSHDFQNFILSIDKLIESAGAPHAFLSNAFWILHRLSGLRFISTVIDKINLRYSSVVIVGPFSDVILKEPELDWESLNWSGFGLGLKPVLAQLKHGINNAEYRQYNLNKNVKSKYIVGKISSIVMRLPELLFRRSVLCIKGILPFILFYDRCVWVVQSGYDVDILSYKCVNTRFKKINLGPKLNAIKSNEVVDYSLIQKDLDKLIEHFLEKWFPYHQNFVSKIFWIYLNQIVSSYPLMISEIRKNITKDLPQAVLYSVGSENILEEAVARVAEEHSIPVFFFKHSGVYNMFVEESIFDPYFEKNPNIKRTQFLSSALELECYPDMDNVECIASGLVSRPKISNVSKNNRKILYSVGPPNQHTFKEMGNTVYDKERYDFAKLLIQLSGELELNIDIKIHPVQASTGFELFQLLLENTKEHHAQIIPEGSIERIFDHYGLIILDMLHTRVLSSVLCLKIPVIIYVPCDFPVHQKYFDDLRGRVYIVRTHQEIVNTLSRFSLSGLPDLYSENFNNKFLGSSDSNTVINIIKTKVFSER